MITPARAIIFVTILASGLPARAEPGCASLLMPAVQLKQVSRGVSAVHSGLDLTAPYGSPVRAAAAGAVIFRGSYFGYGNMIDIRHADGVVTRYAHLASFAPHLAPGRLVAGGTPIGAVGTSGHAHGAHLHFELRIDGRPVDPRPMLALAACTATPPGDAIEQAAATDPRPRPH